MDCAGASNWYACNDKWPVSYPRHVDEVSSTTEMHHVSWRLKKASQAAYLDRKNDPSHSNNPTLTPHSDYCAPCGASRAEHSREKNSMSPTKGRGKGRDNKYGYLRSVPSSPVLETMWGALSGALFQRARSLERWPRGRYPASAGYRPLLYH